MSKTALHVGEPTGQWPVGAKLYLLSQPANGILDRVVVATTDEPHPLDPDAVLTTTTVFAESGVPIIGLDGRSHNEALALLGYSRVVVGDLLGMVQDIHTAAGGTIPGPDGVTWEAEIAATQLVNEAASAFLGDAGFGVDVTESVTNLVVAAVRAAISYGVPIEELIAQKRAEVVQ